MPVAALLPALPPRPRKGLPPAWLTGTQTETAATPLLLATHPCSGNTSNHLRLRAETPSSRRLREMLLCRAPSGRVGDPGKAPLPLAAPATEQRSRAQPCTPPCGDTFFASLIPTPFWGEPPCSSAASARLPHTGCCGRSRGRPSLGPSVRGAAPSSGLPRPRAPPRGSARSRPQLALAERALRALGTAGEERLRPLRRRGRTIRPRPAGPEPPAREVPARVPAGLRPPPGREEATP